MSAVADPIQVEGTLRERIAAKFNPVAEPQAELQLPASAPSPEVPPAAAAPVEQVAAPATTQTDPPVQTEEIFELDLNKNPLDEAPASETPAAEPQPSKVEWEQEFKVLQTTPRGREILNANREFAKLEEVVGYRPEAGQIQQWQRTHSIMDEMVMDFTGGTPDAAAKFASYWFAKDMEGSAQIAEALPAILAQENPEAYQKIGTHFGSTLIDQLAAMAATPGRSAEDVARLADAALVLGAVTGIRPAPGSQPAVAIDPELEALRAENARLKGGQPQVSRVQIENSVYGNLEKVLAADAELTLKPIRKAYESSPEKMVVYNALKREAMTELRSLARKNPAIWNEVTRSIQRMERAGGIDKGQMDEVVRLWRKGYAGNATQIQHKFLNAAGISLTANNDEARGILQQAQQKTAPNGGTAPGQSIQMPTQNPGESKEDFRKRRIHTLLSAPR